MTTYKGPNRAAHELINEHFAANRNARKAAGTCVGAPYASFPPVPRAPRREHPDAGGRQGGEFRFNNPVSCRAYNQASEYFDAPPEYQRPRYILVSDFQTFELHDALAGAGYRGHNLERFLVRIVFCLFADDTGIFEPRDIFFDFIETRTSEDGADLGPWLAQLFQVLDTPDDDRIATLDEDLAWFPYVNGDLFRSPLRIPSFTATMRDSLLEACRFDWSNISPAIFGALFQSVMDPKERRARGAHYTTEKNILKVIEPLFMDDLSAEFARLKSRRDSRRRADLRRFQEKLGQLRFFDPACGCGNFLIIAYRELRLLEIEIIREIRAAASATGQEELDARTLSQVDVDQFYGIELSEFPARIAETALWMNVISATNLAMMPVSSNDRLTVHPDQASGEVRNRIFSVPINRLMIYNAGNSFEPDIDRTKGGGT